MSTAPMSTAEHLAAAIATLGEEGFPAALTQWLHAELAFDNMTLLSYVEDAPPTPVYRAARDLRVHARLDSAYLNGAYLLDPFHQLHLDGVAEGIYRLQDIAPDHFTRGDYYLTYYAATTLTDEIAFLITPAPGVSVMACLGRDATTNRKFSARDLAEVARSAPICLALMRRHWAGLSGDLTGKAGESVPDRLRRNAATLGIALTPRQADVAFLILKGHSTPSIALRLSVSPQTVKVFRKQLYSRCGISSQAELFSLFLPLLGSPEDR
ncbi:helix-turn-helix transcriptional regulator [Celeribacter sp. HF31]|uniref:helix-turn-helix transcriptional regulator n=1 Tax=Celeribacter sp. HF31 TaxID=2721558 RepID=UPI001431A05E|nr:helix-turn-helix transcriptional regulator [Celeribacter sp. HF31]NIY80466.1 helix-turn-helix transcriptional regulator [Celeribacter sp. HF31]